jgi:hypothetical protein
MFLLGIGWMVVALGAGVLGVGAIEHGPATTFFVPSPSLHDAIAIHRPDGPDKMEYQLLDRTTGKTEPIALPAQPDWSLLSLSPWRDQDGNLEAVGRWVSRVEGKDEFCGLGLLKLPEMTVKNRITLDVLPTGKPCWVPGRPGEILFSAGNGQLYRCNIADESQDYPKAKSSRSRRGDGGPIASPRVVNWESRPLNSSLIYVADPVWSSEPGVRHLVFVALSILDTSGSKRFFLPLKLWWLAMNDEGDTILDAGRLIEPAPDDLQSERNYERLPTLVIGEGGKIGLVYVSSTPSRTSWRLRSATIEMDPVTARPRVKPRRGGQEVVAEGLTPSPLVVSADGGSVFGLDDAGHTVKYSIRK